MRRLFFEVKLMGLNALLILLSLTMVLSLIACFGGELLNLSLFGFEVLCPFITAIMVGEWGKTRSDTIFDVISSQSKSILKWLLARFFAAFLAGSLFAIINMVIVFIIRNEMPVWEMILLYISPAFFLSSLCALCGICCSGEHIATLIAGVVWILSMLARSLLRITGVEYGYLFIRYAGDENNIWLINKGVLLLSGFGLWIAIYLICRKRVFVK